MLKRISKRTGKVPANVDEEEYSNKKRQKFATAAALQVLRGHSSSMTASSASSSLLSSPIGSPPPSPLLPVPNLLNARNFSNFLYLQPAPESPELATLLSHGGGPWLRAGPSTHTQALSCCLSRFSLVAPLRGASGGWTRSTSPAPARQCPTHRQRLLGANDHSVHIDTQLHCVLSYQDMSRGCVVGRTWWP